MTTSLIPSWSVWLVAAFVLLAVATAVWWGFRK